MQIPRALSRRMLETVEQTPLVDVYERLMPESKRVSQRFDFISLFSLLALSRRLPNLVLAVGDLWCTAPRLARRR